MNRTLIGATVWFLLLALAIALSGKDKAETAPTTTVDATPYIITAPPTTTTTTTTLPATTKRGSCPEFEALLAQYGLPADPFSYIAWRESRCNPEAVNAQWNEQGEMVYSLNSNGTYDSGLLQINSGHRELVRKVCGKQALANNMAGLRDVHCNLSVAAVLYDNGRGLSHWRATYKQDN